jgi:hypothetical protein
MGEFGLPEAGDYSVWSFWGQKSLLNVDCEFLAGVVPPHGVVLAAVRKWIPGEAVYLGSDLHISQGLEACAWEPGPNGLRLGLRLPRRANGWVTLGLPHPPSKAVLDGSPVVSEMSGEGVYRFPVAFEREAVLQVSIR